MISSNGHLQRIRNLSSVRNVKSDGEQISVEASTRWSSAVLSSVLEDTIDGMSVSVESPGPRFGTRPSRRHTINNQNSALEAIAELSGGDVEATYKPQEAPKGPRISRRGRGRGSRPRYDKPATPEFQSINVTVSSPAEQKMADALIADKVYGAPVTINIIE